MKIKDGYAVFDMTGKSFEAERSPSGIVLADPKPRTTSWPLQMSIKRILRKAAVLAQAERVVSSAS